MTIKKQVPTKDQKLPYSLQYRLYLYRQSLKKSVVGATTLLRSKLLLTQQLLTCYRKLPLTFNLQLDIDADREAEFAEELKGTLNERNAAQMKRIAKKKLKIGAKN